MKARTAITTASHAATPANTYDLPIVQTPESKLDDLHTEDMVELAHPVGNIAPAIPNKRPE